MAVPTITSLGTTEGTTRGTNVIFINGTNFRLPPSAEDGYSPGQAQQTVKVSFNGVDSAESHAISGTLLMTSVPAWTGGTRDETPVVIDVRVANLDDDGDEVAGENVTSSGAYSYYRPNFISEMVTQTVTRKLVQQIRRSVLPNTVVRSTPAIDDDTADDLDSIRQAELPVIIVSGPSLVENDDFKINQMDQEDDQGQANMYYRNRPPITSDLAYSIQIWGKAKDNIYAVSSIVHNMMMMFRDQPHLVITSEMTVPVEMVNLPAHTNPTGTDGLESATMSCSVLGVDIDDVNGTIIERGFDVHDADGSDVVSENMGD